MENDELLRDELFTKIDDLCWEGQYEKIDELLEKASIDDISSSLIRAYLVITKPVRHALKNRADFYDRAYARLVKLRGEENAKRLLERLK